MGDFSEMRCGQNSISLKRTKSASDLKKKKNKQKKPSHLFLLGSPLASKIHIFNELSVRLMSSWSGWTDRRRLWTHLSRSPAVRHEKYLGVPADRVTWKQWSRPRTDGWSGLISTAESARPPPPRSRVCMMVWPDKRLSWDLEVLRRGGAIALHTKHSLYLACLAGEKSAYCLPHQFQSLHALRLVLSFHKRPERSEIQRHKAL